MIEFKKIDIPSYERYRRYLPSAFDSSLDIYEKLCHVLECLNQYTNMTDEIIKYINGYMEDFFNNFDKNLHKTVEDILTEWLESGVFDDKLAEYVTKLKDYQIKPVGNKVGYGEGSLGGFGKDAKGSHNLIAIGQNALGSAGEKTKNNEAIGNGAQENNKYAKYNTSVGFDTLKYLVGDPNDENSGSRMTIIGSNAGRFIERGMSNIAMGRNALQTAVDSSFNTALGAGSMFGNAPLDLDDVTIVNNTPVMGSWNTAVGASTLMFTSGNYNVGVGFEAGAQIKSGERNTMLGYQAGNRLEWALSQWGNRMLLMNFAGTIEDDANDVTMFKVPTPNGQFVVGDSIHVTYQIEPPLMHDVKIEKVGAQYIYFKKPQDTTIPAGTKIIFRRHGYDGKYKWNGRFIEIATDVSNMSIGRMLLVKIGSHEVNWFEVTGVETGKVTLKTNIDSPVGGETGDCFVNAIDTMIKMGKSQDNTFIGSKSGWNANTSTGNTAIGSLALQNVASDQNTAVGYLALSEMYSGKYNTAIGYNAGRFTTDNANNDSFSNTTCIGFNSRVSGSNQMQLGNGETDVYTFKPIQQRSDRRDKADIEDSKLGLAFIEKLRPVDYSWDLRDSYVEYDEEGNITGQHVKDGSKKSARRHHGFIAQEIGDVIKEMGIDFGGYQDHSVSDGSDVHTVSYTEMVAPLVKAVQELSARVKELESR